MIDSAHKITLPQRPAHLVERLRLRALVETIATRQLVLLIAPAGYGKTSVLIDWAHATPYPVCWYSLDRFDADPQTFLACLGETLLQRYPQQLPLTAALIRSGTSWSLDLAVATIGREVAALGETVVLVFDDWHLVDHVPRIGEALASILHRAANFRAVLASRSYPSVPNIMLLTAHGQVTGLADSQLRFTAEEAAAVLAHYSSSGLAAADVATLTAKANGWITAIVLMARAPELASQAASAVGHGSERRVFEFLTEQVFDQLDTELRAFLLDAALLEDLQAARCDELLGRQDSGVMLERLLRQHLFVSEIEGGVLRFHPLFREFLIERYRRDQRPQFQATALRVAQAYAARALWAQAFELCMMADDPGAAQAVLARGGYELFHQGQLATLERCFEALPLQGLSATLLCIKGLVHLSQGATQQAQILADLAQARMQASEELEVRLFQANVAQTSGEYQEAIQLADEVLAGTPSDEQRAMALRLAANCRNRLGDGEQALELLGEALQIQRRRGDLYHLALIYHDMGVLHEQAGRLRDAERCYTQSEGYWSTLGNIGARALSRNSAAVVLHMLGRYREAHAQLIAALTDAQTTNVPVYLAAIAASLGDLYADLGLGEMAEESYERAREAKGSAFMQGYVEVAMLWLHVRRRRFASALSGLERLEPRVAERHAGRLALLRAAVACGQQRFEAARELVRKARPSPEPSEDTARTWIWEARILSDQGRAAPSTIVWALDRAVAVAKALGRDAFLVAELAQHPALLRHAAALGWAPAAYFSERVAELRAIGQRVSGTVGVPILAIQALGGDRIEIDGAAIDLGLRKAREALYFLLARPHGATIDELREALWPEREETSTRYLLRTAVHQLRAALPPNLITMRQRRIYEIVRGAVRLEYDVERFLALTDQDISDPEVLGEGLDLYRGAFLPWCEGDWSQEIRSYLEQRFVQGLHRAARAYERLGRVPQALDLYARALALDPLDEAATAGAMRCHIALGNRAAAIDSYQRARRRLSADLGLDPDPGSELEQIYLQLCEPPR